MATTRRALPAKRRELLKRRLAEMLGDRAYSLTALASLLRTSRRTILRAISELRQEGTTIYSVSDGDLRTYQMGSPMAHPIKPGTAEALLNSPLIGMWADRKDIKNGAEYARRIQKLASRRLV